MTTLRFPDDYAGSLTFTVGEEQSSVHARGAVVVPDGAEVSLSVSRKVDLSWVDPELTDEAALAAQRERLQEVIDAAPPIDLSPLAELPEDLLSALSFQMAHVTDADVDVIVRQGSLRHLALGSCTLDAVSTKKLQGLSRLAVLMVSFMPSIEEHHCDLLRSLPALTELEVFGATDAVCSALAETRLTRLRLMAARVTDDGLRDLARLGTLRDLSVIGSVGDEGIEAIAQLPALEAVELLAFQASLRIVELFRDYPHRLTTLRFHGLEVPQELDIAVRRAHPGITFQGMTFGERAVEKMAARLG